MVSQPNTYTIQLEITENAPERAVHIDVLLAQVLAIGSYSSFVVKYQLWYQPMQYILLLNDCESSSCLAVVIFVLLAQVLAVGSYSSLVCNIDQLLHPIA